MIMFQMPTAADLNDGIVPKGAKTEEYYHVTDIPDRFNNPGNPTDYTQHALKKN